MGANEGALVALHALGGIPLGNGDGDAPLLVSGSAQLKGTVSMVNEGGDRQAVAIHLVHRIQNVGDHLHGLLPTGLGSVGLVILGLGPGSGNLNLHVGGGAGIDGGIVHIHQADWRMVLVRLPMPIFLARSMALIMYSWMLFLAM